MRYFRLLPKEPIKRANIRFAIEYFGSKVNASSYKYVFNSKAEGAREAYENDINAALVRVS
jgi:glutathione S-transferase